MADVNLPVIGDVPDTYVWAGGALVAGIVGYAYVTRNKRGTLDAGDELIGPEGEVYDAYGNLIGQPGSTPGYVPPTVTNSNRDVDDREGVRTNGEWTIKARDEMVAFGANGSAVTAALGKFFARQPLTAIEADLVRQAIAVAGQPPEGGPWTVIEPTVTPPGELAAPTVTAGNLTPTSATFNWTRPQNAVKFIVGREVGGVVVDERDVGNTAIFGWTGAAPGSTIALRVWAVSDQGTRGAMGRASVKLPAGPAGKRETGTHRVRIGKVGQPQNPRGTAARYAPSQHPDAVEATLRRIVQLNPALRGRTSWPGGYLLTVPIYS